MNRTKIIIWSILAILLIGVMYQIEYGNERVVTANVIKTERVTDKSSYLVFTNKGTFRIQDQLLFGKFNSSDIYGSIEEGHNYTFKLTGYRVPVLSMYPNIAKVIGKREMVDK